MVETRDILIGIVALIIIIGLTSFIPNLGISDNEDSSSESQTTSITTTSNTETNTTTNGTLEEQSEDYGSDVVGGLPFSNFSFVSTLVILTILVSKMRLKNKKQVADK